MEFSPAGRAGTFLGFWTMMVTVARGVGVASGGILCDLTLSLTDNPALSYTAVFVLEAGGLVVALWILSRISVRAFQANYARQKPADSAAILAGAME
jgi:MFS transporter, BCD family, chlorophyll transporter